MSTHNKCVLSRNKKQYCCILVEKTNKQKLKKKKLMSRVMNVGPDKENNQINNFHTSPKTYIAAFH